MARTANGIAQRAFRLTKSIKSRWAVALSLTALVAAGLVVQAVHDEAFELDGNTADDPASPKTDWASLFDVVGNNVPTPKTTLPTGFAHASFTRDFQFNANNGNFINADTTTFTTGSKDILPIATDWQCTTSNNVTDKDDILNAYAVAYTAPNGEKFLYFGMERNANNGDANMGFWFLQGDVKCPQGGGLFQGAHKDGDLFIVSAFSNGGLVSTIDVYRWDIPNPSVDPIGFLRTTPISSGGDCDTAPAGDDECATANKVGITVPWLTAAKSLNSGNAGTALPVAQFFEGGINLTNTGFADKCFNTFVGDTRSSSSLTATIFDFTGGTIGECSSGTVTTPSIPNTNLGIGSQDIPLNGTLAVTDSAAVTVDGVSSFTGSVAFHLCGPFAANATDRCATGGVDAGTKSLTANGTVVSDTMTVTSVGRYCWRADFSATDPTGIPPSSDSRESECFLVTPVTPTLTTQGNGTVNFGLAVTDTATLSGTANAKGSGGPAGSTDGSINPTVPGAKAGSKITFTLVTAATGCSTLATGTGTNPQDVTVSGDATYGPVSFIPGAPGTYNWKATYTSDTANTNGVSHNSGCTNANEVVIVQTIPTAIKTRQNWIPNDTATISSTAGNLAAGGSAAFTLFASADCTGTVVFGPSSVSVPGGSPSAEVSTSNTTPITTLYPDAANSTKGPYSWKVVYTPAAADTAHEGRQSSCETFTITYTNSNGPGTKFP